MKPWTKLDKLLWKIMRWATGFIVRPLMFLKISPNQLTAGSSVINFSLAAFCFLHGTYYWNLAGLGFLILHSYFDFADGTLARATGQSSKLGGWLDPRLDVVGSEAVTVALVFGVIRSNPQDIFWLIIGALTLFGHLGLLSVVFDYDRDVYKNKRFDELTSEKSLSLPDTIIKEFITLHSFIFLFIGTFRYFLPLMILLNQIKVLLIVTAVFVNLRWIIMFWAYAKAYSEEKTSSKLIKLLSELINKK